MFFAKFARAALMTASCLLLGSIIAPAQETEIDPIKWSLQIKTAAASVKAGDQFLVQLTAQFENGWHLYSTDQIEGGPKPTRISLPSGQAFEKAGEIDSPGPRTSFDPNFQVETQFYDQPVTFDLPVRVLPSATGGSTKLLIEVRYQTCTQTVCLPPKLLKLETYIQIAGAGEGLVNESSRPTSTREKPSEALAIGADVPDFAFTDFGGKARRFSEFRGRYVLLDFWATWCSPCLADIPELKKAYAKYHAKGLEIIGMDSETLGADQSDPDFAKESQLHAREIVNTRGVSWTQATADTAVPAAVKVFGVASLPAKILIDRKGRVMARITKMSELDQILSPLLSTKD
jgi:thiol-disulfide isomerase/thioredoxin